MPEHPRGGGADTGASRPLTGCWRLETANLCWDGGGNGATNPNYWLATIDGWPGLGAYGYGNDLKVSYISRA